MQFVSEAMVTVGKSGDSREIYCEHAGGGRGGDAVRDGDTGGAAAH